MDNNVGMAQRYEHEIPEGYEARIEGNKVIIERKESVDERIRKNIISWLKNIEGQTIPINEYNSALAWLEKQEQKEQKPAEWSEEDERIRTSILSLLSNELSIPQAKTYISWLKSLHLQPRAKADEEGFEHIVGHLVQDIVANEHLPLDTKQPTSFFVNKYVNKLSQPHWKPSEEQMEALDIAQMELCGTKYNEGLCSLIDDLKKL